MTRSYAKTAIACALLALSAQASAQWREDDLGTDFYEQNDMYTQALNNPESTTNFYQRQVDWMLANQYPPASIVLSAVSRGMTVADVVYFMAHSQPEKAREFYDMAVEIMPSLPGWACSEDSAIPNRYAQEITPRELPAQPSLEQLSKLYFEQGRRLMDYPEWEGGEGHVNIQLDELLDLKQRDIDQMGHESWWYLPSERLDTSVIMASFYPGSARVVIDARQDELEALSERGVTSVPVMVLYGEMTHIPLSDVNSDIEKADEADEEESEQPPAEREAPKEPQEIEEITAMDVVSRYESTGERASPTRDWHKGDHHLQATVEDLDQLFELPEKDDIPEWEQQAIRQRLEQGLEKPLLITLWGEDSSDRFVDEAKVITMAQDMELEELPVVFFYNDMGRQPCGVPASCAPHIREAVEAGSGRNDLFEDEPDDSSRPLPPDGLYLVPPPPVPPTDPEDPPPPPPASQS